MATSSVKLRTLPIVDFKAEFGHLTMNVIKNPHTGFLFIDAVTATYPVSKKYDITKAKVMALLPANDEYKNPTWVLCNPGEDNLVEEL